MTEWTFEVGRWFFSSRTALAVPWRLVFERFSADRDGYAPTQGLGDAYDRELMHFVRRGSTEGLDAVSGHASCRFSGNLPIVCLSECRAGWELAVAS